MTERSPSMPAPFQGTPPDKSIEPNPRTVRGGDMSWFNTRGDKIIKTNYNTCTGNLSTHMYPWGVVVDPQNIPFNLKPWGGQGQCNMFQRFELYGASSKCQNRCGSSGGYVNPN